MEGLIYQYHRRVHLLMLLPTDRYIPVYHLLCSLYKRVHQQQSSIVVVDSRLFFHFRVHNSIHHDTEMYFNLSDNLQTISFVFYMYCNTKRVKPTVTSLKACVHVGGCFSPCNTNGNAIDDT